MGLFIFLTAHYHDDSCSPADISALHSKVCQIPFVFWHQKIEILLIYLYLHNRTCITDSTNGSIETQVHTGSLWNPSPNGGSYEIQSNGDGVLSDQAKNDDPIVIEDEIEFPDGWTPVHYE